MIYRLLYKLLHKPKKKSPVMIRAKKLNGAKITDNVGINTELLEVEELTNSEVKRNKVTFVSPEKLHWFWKYSIDFFFSLFLAYIIFKIGWNRLFATSPNSAYAVQVAARP